MYASTHIILPKNTSICKNDDVENYEQFYWLLHTNKKLSGFAVYHSSVTVDAVSRAGAFPEPVAVSPGSS